MKIKMTSRNSEKSLTQEVLENQARTFMKKQHYRENGKYFENGNGEKIKIKTIYSLLDNHNKNLKEINFQEKFDDFYHVLKRL